MYKLNRILLIALFLFKQAFSFAQNCNCSISQVENNTVAPCALLIGKVDTVTNAIGLRNAIIQANADKGNHTILIADGTYQIASTSWFPYITGSNIVFRSLSGKRDAVILTGEGMKNVSPKVESGFYIVGNNVTIADLTIKEVGNHGIACEGDSLFVHNVKIQNTFEQMIKGTGAGDGADQGRVQCSLFEYPAGVGPQFYIGGLDIHKGNDWLVNDNVFKNIASPSGSLAEHAVHFWKGSANNIVERNIMVNCDRGIGFGLGSSRSDSGIIRNNMIFNDGEGLFHDVGISLETSPSTKVYNNTIFIEYRNAIEYRFPATTDVIISNNLTNKPINSRDGGKAELSTNITNAKSTWFQDPSIGNLRLISENTEVVDKGVSLAEVVDDIDQIARPQGTKHDIGAHEFEQGVGINRQGLISKYFQVFPNPAKSKLVIKSRTNSNFNAEMSNFLNQKIASFKKESTTSELVIDVGRWQAGIYVLRITSQDSTSESHRIIVSKRD